MENIGRKYDGETGLTRLSPSPLEGAQYTLPGNQVNPFRKGLPSALGGI